MGIGLVEMPLPSGSVMSVFESWTDYGTLARDAAKRLMSPIDAETCPVSRFTPEHEVQVALENTAGVTYFDHGNLAAALAVSLFLWRVPDKGLFSAPDTSKHNHFHQLVIKTCRVADH